jgi:hypothetical protein
MSKLSFLTGLAKGAMATAGISPWVYAGLGAAWLASAGIAYGLGYKHSSETYADKLIESNRRAAAQAVLEFATKVSVMYEAAVADTKARAEREKEDAIAFVRAEKEATKGLTDDGIKCALPVDNVRSLDGIRLRGGVPAQGEAPAVHRKSRLPAVP